MKNLLGPAKTRDIPDSCGVEDRLLLGRTVLCFDFNATFGTAPLISKAGGDENSERGHSGYEVTSGGATDASIALMGAWGGLLLGIVVKRSVVLETKLLLLHWHSHLFQSSLASHHVLGLLSPAAPLLFC